MPSRLRLKKKTRLGWHDIIETRAIPIGFVALLTAFAYSSIMSFITAYSESKASAGVYQPVFYCLRHFHDCGVAVGRQNL